MSDTERLLDIKEAAEFLNVSETSLRRWTNSGRLACLRIGRRRERRFRHADLLAFTELDQSVERAPPARVSRADSRTVAERVSVTHGTHLCGLYSTDEDRVRLGAQFLAGGLAPTGFCYVFGAESARASIVNELERREPSVARDRENGRLITGEYAPSPSLQL